MKSVGIDYMHCILLGDQKKLLSLFCDQTFSNRLFYIPKKKQIELNKRILAIKPNREVVRKPRSLKDRAKYKASEFRSMLLYYLPVCLSGLIPDVYVKHLRLLSAATYILLKKTITYPEIDQVEKMLKTFVANHQKLFGKEHMVMNIHLLKHVPEDVRSLGPLWCHSAFAFERNNGVLLKKVNGTTDVLVQIASKYCLSKAIDSRRKTTHHQNILLGRSTRIIENSLRVFNIETLKEMDFSKKELFVHKRINLNGIIYTGTMYTLPKKSIDYFMGLQDDLVGKAKFYFESNKTIYVVMEEFTVVDHFDHIMKIQPTRRNILAPVTTIKQKYLFMKVGLHQYIVSPPNPYETE